MISDSPRAQRRREGDSIGSGRTAASLASVRAGESIRVRSFLFDQLSSDCAQVGLHVGDVMMCRNTSSAHVHLESGSGRRVLLHRDWARWIEVERSRP